MTNDIFCVGLTRTELQTLGVLLPITFRIIPVSSEALDHAAVVRVIDQARCIILNPKRLSVDLLDDFLRGQDYQRWNNAPVPIILFSDTMTKEQRHEVFMPEYPILSVDLHERFDRNRNLAVKLLRESTLPCWQNREVMRSNMFNDAWYLIDIKTTGLDRWKDYRNLSDLCQSEPPPDAGDHWIDGHHRRYAEGCAAAERGAARLPRFCGRPAAGGP